MFARLFQTRRPCPSTPRRTTQRLSLRLEELEDRLAPASFTLTEGGDDGLNMPAGTNDQTGQVHDAQGNPTGRITLRSAMEQNDLDSGGDTITFGSVLSVTTSGVSTSQQLTLQGMLDGSGHPMITIHGGVTVGPGSLVTNLYITGASGTGLSMGENSTVSNCVVSGNQGDGLYLGSSCTAQNCYVGTSLDGSAAQGNGGSGIAVRAKGTIQDCVISANQGYVGLWLESNGTLVTGCKIGTDVTGMKNLGNQGPGIWVFGCSNNTIGGTNAADRNIISGNLGGGIALVACGPQPSNNLIEGNYIGVDATGSTALANRGAGISGSDAQANTIGGSANGAGNVISGNTGAGIALSAMSESSGNVIQGNRIGTDDAGQQAVPNGGTGIDLYSCTNTTVGGTDGAARNIISGNFSGVQITSFSNTGPATGNVVVGNYIGTNGDGSQGIPNRYDGVELGFKAQNNTIAYNVISANGGCGVNIDANNATGNQVQSNTIGTQADGHSNLGNARDGVCITNNASNNTIGGADGGAGNTIAYNGLNGVAVRSGTGNAILGNSIFAHNNGLGIDLGEDGVTLNHSGGAVDGPNHWQNFPVFTSLDDTHTLLHGILNSDPHATYRIELFANDAGNPSGYGEGQTFLGFLNVTTDDLGNATFDVTVPPSPFLTATATDSAGNTSEFSSYNINTGGSGPKVADLGLAVKAEPNPVVIGQPVTVTLTVTNSGPFAASSVVLNDALPAGVSVVSITSSQGAVGQSNGSIVVQLGTLAKGASATITLVVTAQAPGTFTDTARVTANESDPTPADNMVTQAITFLPTGDPLQRFVAEVYQDMLARTVDAGGLATWTAFLVHGGSGSALADAIVHSAEYQTLMIQGLYQTILHRAADPAGLNTFVGFLAKGGTPEQVAVQLAGSAEYFQTRGGGTNSGFLAAIFPDLLGRPIDASGQDGFNRMLANGASRTQVAAAMMNSTEYRRNLVQSDYQHLLHRAADASGLDNFVTLLQNGTSDTEVSVRLVGSDEYFTTRIDPRGTPNQRFVSQLYHDLLSRPVDASGLASWSAFLDHGGNRNVVAQRILASAEYQALVVKQLYQTILHREADPAGLGAYTALLGNGGTAEQVAEALAGSAEYLQARGNGTVRGFLDALFHDALNRDPDSSGLATFGQLLASGTSQSQVAETIFRSSDYQQHLVQNFYESFLGRPADGSGLQSFVTALQQGVRDETVIANLVDSDEYFIRLQAD